MTLSAEIRVTSFDVRAVQQELPVAVSRRSVSLDQPQRRAVPHRSGLLRGQYQFLHPDKFKPLNESRFDDLEA
jgi:ferric-dicitrate binding protein FerR (iron transport regulator)